MSPENTLHGWVPVQFAIESGEIFFRWMELSATDISEPFFRQTVEKLIKLGNKTRTTKVQELIMMGGSTPAIRPSCLIFHVSRCGSTLLTNALRASTNCIVLSEPKVITDLFHFCYDLPAAARGLRDSILQSIVNLYATLEGKQRSLVIKLASWNVLNLRMFRKLWPETPYILLIRSPVEVIISNLKPGGWLAFRCDPKCSAGLLELGEMQVAQMSDIEFCARVIKRLNEAAQEGMDSKGMILDYSMLDFNLMPAIAEFIGFDKMPLNRDAVMSTFRMYSKDQNGIRVFEDDRPEKRRKAGELITAADADLAKESYNSLLRIALDQSFQPAKEIRLTSGV
jgi:hypothetical protein